MPSQSVFPSCQLPAPPASASPWQQSRFSAPLSPTHVPQYEPATWVRVFDPPTAFSFNEARLLCQCSEQEWLAWIPDYGEILLHTDQFCSLDHDAL